MFIFYPGDPLKSRILNFSCFTNTFQLKIAEKAGECDLLFSFHPFYENEQIWKDFSFKLLRYDFLFN